MDTPQGTNGSTANGQEHTQEQMLTSGFNPTLPPEIKEQMDLSLGIKPTAVTEAAQTGTEQAKPQDTPTSTSAPQFTFDTIGKKFNWASEADMEKEVGELRAFKATPPPAQEYKFENEVSKNILQHLSKGDIKSVTKILNEQERIENAISKEVTAQNAEEIIKLGMGLKYTNLSAAEVDYQYKRRFDYPKEPLQRIDEDAEDFDIRKSEWKQRIGDIDMEKSIEAKMLRPEIEAAKSKIVLPEIDADPAYTQWLKSKEAQEKVDETVNQQIAEAYKAFTPEMFEMKLPFKDETNKVNFEFQHKPESVDLAKVIENAGDIETLLKNFETPDGKPDRQAWANFLYHGFFHKKILGDALNQAKNGTIQSRLPDNSQGGLLRQMAPAAVEESDIDKQMRERGISRGANH